MPIQSKSAQTAAHYDGGVRSPRCARATRRTALGVFCALVSLGALLAAPPLSGQHGARVMHRNLAELVSDAGTIVHGRILSVRIEPHPQYQGLQTAVVNIEIIELLKGQSGAPFSYRQYLIDQRDGPAKLGYKIGQEVLLLMLKAHPQTGLSSPAGMEQGRFRVARDAAGNRIVTNGVNNGGIFRGMDPATDSKLQSLSPATRAFITQHRGGPVPYDHIKAIILALAAN